MDILPAIDIRDGKVVRLQRGDYDRQTTYADDPAAIARQFAQAGARWIHVVDLDAARSGRSSNLESVQAIRSAVNVDIELGGGARDDASLDRMLDAGATRVVVGSAAMKNWPWFEGLLAREGMPQRLALGLDARDGKLAAEGWTEQTALSAVELARRVRESGLAAIVYTDIARDGMLTGVNVAATAEMAAATDVPVIASGGVSTIEDVRLCREAGCGGVIIGKAWYEGRIDLAEALSIAAAGR